MSDVETGAIGFDQVVAAESGEPRKAWLNGQEFTLVENPPAGAFLIFMRRLDDKSEQVKMAALVRLLEKWVVKDDHERLFETIEDVTDVQGWMEGDLAKFIEVATARPT